MNEATDALMATLGEYDVLWDGVLSPEIVDAELYDCYGNNMTATLPAELVIPCLYRFLMQRLDRMEALYTLIEIVKCYAGTCIDTLHFSEEFDAEVYDCPTIRSLK